MPTPQERCLVVKRGRVDLEPGTCPQARRPAIAAAAILTLTAATHAATITAGPACGMAQRTVQEASGGIWTLSRPNPFGLPSAQAAKFCVKAAAGPGFTIASNVP